MAEISTTVPGQSAFFDGPGRDQVVIEVCEVMLNKFIFVKLEQFRRIIGEHRRFIEGSKGRWGWSATDEGLIVCRIVPYLWAVYFFPCL